MAPPRCEGGDRPLCSARRTVTLLTSNQGKVKEFRDKLSHLEIEIDYQNWGYPEIQSEAHEEVVAFAAPHIAAMMVQTGKKNLLYDDSGLWVDSLKGFPGIYSSNALKTLGTKGLLKQMEGIADRSAEFRCVLGFITFDPSWMKAEGGAAVEGKDCSLFVFPSVVRGRIALTPSGTGGFGFDPIFIPDGFSKTYSEISIGEKNKVSHRALAIEQFVGFMSGLN